MPLCIGFVYLIMVYLTGSSRNIATVIKNHIWIIIWHNSTTYILLNPLPSKDFYAIKRFDCDVFARLIGANNSFVYVWRFEYLFEELQEVISCFIG